MIKIYLSGEGPVELGGRAGDPAYHTDRPGVIETLLRARVPSGWEVCGARPWKNIPKLRARPGETAEAQNVRGAELDAREAGCDVLVFVRDRDRDEDRERLIEETVKELLGEGRRIVGGVACECIDAWLLAVAGERGAEARTSSDAKKRRELRAVSTDHAVALIEERGVTSLPDDAKSLAKWLDRVGDELR